MILTKHETVMRRVKAGDKDVDVFFDNKEYTRKLTPPPSSLHLERGVWAAMGRPDVITITVLPGDALNVASEEVRTRWDGGGSDDGQEA